MSNYSNAKGNVFLAGIVSKETIINTVDAMTQQSLVGIAIGAYGVAVAADYVNIKAILVVAHADRKMVEVCAKSASLRTKYDAVRVAKEKERQAKLLAFSNAVKANQKKAVA
jgi:carbonic anhydrase